MSAGLLASAIQCGDLPSCSSNPRPQSSGSNRPTPGSRPTRPGKATVVAVAKVSGATSVGRSSSAASAAASAIGPWRPCDGRSRSVVPVIPSGSRTDDAHHVLERLARPRGDDRAQRVEPRVRIDPARPGRRERHRALEPETRRMGQQVTDGRARRPGLVVERDETAVHGDQHGQRGDELGHRRPPKDVVRDRPAEP